MGVEENRLGVPAAMLCRRLRELPYWRLPLIVFVSLALIVGIGIPPLVLHAEQTPSLTIRAHELPLIALAETTGIRIEKQAQSQRSSLRKPDRIAHLVMPVAHDHGPRLSVRIQHVFRNLPRRQLHALRVTPRSPDDPSSLLS